MRLRLLFNDSSLFMILVLLSGNIYSQEILPYKNPDLCSDERSKDLLSRMTPDEKFWQLFMIPGDLSIGKEKLKEGIFGLQVDAKGETNDAAGQILTYVGLDDPAFYAEKLNQIQRFFLSETRLGIPVIPFAESLHGLCLGGSTSFPQSIGLAASWDTALMSRVAQSIAKEVKARGIRQVLGPVINLARDVRWGRVEETFGEDPFLTSVMGFCYMNEFEKMGIITTPKHFAANVGDGGRDSYPIHYNERLLEEIYFPAFKTGIQKAGARSVMSSYNSLDGVPCTANDWLLNKKLKQEWGFQGFVISDACAIGGANVLHFTAKDYTDATEQAIKGGLDVIFQTDYHHFSLFKDAFDKGLIPQPVIDSAVFRVLKAKFQLGLFEDPYVSIADAAFWNGHASHRDLALQAARESIVLLKNNEQALPLKPGLKKVAVIGKDAIEARLGGYSGPGNNKISILDGIRMHVASASEVVYAEGCDRRERLYVTVPSEYLFSDSEDGRTQGLKGEYFNSIDLSGNPVLKRIDPQIAFGWTLYSPGASLAFDWYSVRWTGKLVAPASGVFQIGIEGNDGYRIYLDGQLLIDNWRKQSSSVKMATLSLEKGREYDLRVEYYESSGSARIRLVWDVGVKDEATAKIEEAVQLASSADAVVLVAGIEEGEFNDRAFLSLPGRQEELIRAVAGCDVPLVVILIGGSAITMNNWIDHADAILDAWYPGEVGGYAVADVLFGSYNPAGRLPITFPVFEGQLPLYYNHKPSGRGDDYTDLTGRPLFPFGYGLSYTSFAYSDLTFDRNSISKGESARIHFMIKNMGNKAGDEVYQLYIRDDIASVARPVKELKGFSRIHLEPGEEKEVEFVLTPEMLTMLDKDLKEVIEPGDFRIMIGASSEDIRLRGMLKVE